MASARILRALWRNRVAAAIVCALAIAAGYMVSFGTTFPPKSKRFDVGVASVSVLVDTPKSQVVEVDPAGSETLAARANVLANLMVDGDIKSAIAHRAGVAPNKLVATVVATDGSTSTGAAPVLTKQSLAYSTSVAMTSDMEQLPIIRISTRAPDVGRAITLANDAVAGLTDYLNAKAANETVADNSRLRVRALGTAQGQSAPQGPSNVKAFGVFIFVLMFGFSAILGITALRRGWRAAVAAEQNGELEPVAVFEPVAMQHVAERDAQLRVVPTVPHRGGHTEAVEAVPRITADGATAQGARATRRVPHPLDAPASAGSWCAR